MLKLASVALLLAAAAPAMAQDPASDPATPTAKTNPLDKIICRTEEGLGSRLNRKKVCMTVREWKDQAQDSREATERMQQQNQGIAPSG